MMEVEGTGGGGEGGKRTQANGTKLDGNKTEQEEQRRRPTITGPPSQVFFSKVYLGK